MRLLTLALLTLTACPKDPDETGGDFPPVCNAGTQWTDGQTAFVEATADWGLDIINAEATRINAVDFDGDGWVDLALRRATDAPDDFAEGGTRNAWLLRNDGQGGFEDVTESSGIRSARAGDNSRGGQVWAFADADNDGDLDVFISIADTSAAYDETSELLLNNGDGTFSLGNAGDDIRYNGDTSPASASWTDIDRDGWADLWVPENYMQSRLYKNDGDGSFTDITYDADLGTAAWSSVEVINSGQAHAVSWSGLACDLNNDGYAELMAASYGRAPNLLFQSVAGVNYTNRSVDSNYAFDHRQDWTDNESARCWCKLHPEDDDCEGVPDPAITCTQDDHAFRWSHDSDREAYRLGGNSGATTCADVNNDGWMDLLTSEIVHWDVGSSSDPAELLFNTQATDVTFDRPGNEVTGLEREHTVVSWNDGDMSNAVFDFDNDGWPDVFIGSSDYEGCRALLWQNQGDETFVTVPHDMGPDHTRSHGVGAADFDRDGDLDLVLGHSSSRCEDDCYETFGVRYYENVTGEAGSNFVQLSLEGTTANRAAIGARVQVTAGGVTQTQEIGGGYGHYGAQQPLSLHFGLGTACDAEVTVRWPDTDLTEQSFTVGGGYRYHVVQGEEPVPEAL